MSLCCVVMLNVIRMGVVMLIVVAPFYGPNHCLCNAPFVYKYTSVRLTALGTYLSKLRRKKFCKIGP
jgi:hypothetical protein